MAKFRCHTLEVEAVRVTAADWNGDTWDGNPFTEIPLWLHQAMEQEEVSLVREKGYDYARWRIGKTETQGIAGPGDYIIRLQSGTILLCAGKLFRAIYETMS